MSHRGSVGISPARAGVRARPGSARVLPACSHPGAGVSGSPCIPSRVLGIRTPRTPPSLRVGEGGRGMLTGVDVLASPCVPSPVSAIRTPRTPPAPRVGEGGRGDEGANAHGNVENRASLPGTLPLRADIAEWERTLVNRASCSARFDTTPQFSVLGSQFSVLDSKFSVPGSQFSALGF